MSTIIQPWSEHASDRVLEIIRSKQLLLEPKAVVVAEETDALGDSAWQLGLVLPAPSGDTWDRDQVFATRRAAVEAFDMVAEEGGRALPGSTVAFVTTDEADELDTAPMEEPEPGEDPGYGR